ncbi:MULTISPECIES: hypothetical protein [Pseudonocardiaceae]|uniref:Uncharacterized protein n=1 Tax=Prauserella endophytica TaxID=1592324 RepID=A0ABY2RTP1_9PSEU|nr:MULTISPECIES: hypothetical protein [Pseudonocardiaceae]TKG60241.1 hypothetical protein FCN18_35730 [Prauserella endophytica]
MISNVDARVVSLNGVDNVGKTTQLAWLSRSLPGAHLVGTVDRWDTRWQQVASGDFAQWWFVASTTPEHTGLVLGSHAARRAGSGQLALEDRGLPMLLATCAATAVVKDGFSPADALHLVENIATDLPVAEHRREVHVLLRRSPDPAREAHQALRREPRSTDRRYVAYQHALAEVVSLQVARGDYHTVLEIEDAPILDVQNRLREHLRGFGVHAGALPVVALDRLWVLAGMSESGKSSVGELLRDELGVTRLKIGYLLDVAALRAGEIDPYAWSESEQAERLTEEVLRFAETTKARTISVESAHRFEATAHLKRVWGEHCQVAYVDADSAVRASRAAETEVRLRARDETKHERGADRIVDIADHVIDNTGSLAALKLAVHRLVATADLQHVALDTSDPVTHAEWLRQASDHIVDEQVALVLATGTTGTAGWRDRWSDLDLLVVRDTAPADWLRRTLGALPIPDGIKMGISTFTTSDIDALRVPPRVVQSLRRAAQGVGVIYHRPGYRVPVPVSAHGDRTSRGELGLILMTTRRLLAAPMFDVRAVHKHLVLLAKILLRADGYHFDDVEDVLAVFRDLHPDAACDPPVLDDLIDRSDDPAVRQRLLEAADRLLSYVDRLDHIVRTSA